MTLLDAEDGAIGRSDDLNYSALAYPLVVEWSDEDQVFIGSCPGIIGPYCRGSERREVLRQLVQIVNDWLKDEEETEVAIG